jgi:hypothetical protein
MSPYFVIPEIGKFILFSIFLVVGFKNQRELSVSPCVKRTAMSGKHYHDFGTICVMVETS